ncbi:MAG: hypothetical protein WA655_09390 [Candidatus Korobacteraceae bacterium]
MSVPQSSRSKENYLVMVLSVSFVLGMAVAVGVYFLWRSQVVSPALHSLFTGTALFVCPPFILSFVVGATPDSDLAWVLLVGAMVFGNGFLYAGVATGIYAAVTMLLPRGKRR